MLPNVLQYVLPEWIESFEEFVRENLGAVPPRAEFERLAMQQVLTSDLRVMGRSSLPPDMHQAALQGQPLQGPHLLQIDEWREIGRPKQQGDGLVDVEVEMEDAGVEEPVQGLRAKKEVQNGALPSGKRMLKLMCSGDASKTVEAFEYRYCGELNAGTLSKGCKLVVQNVLILRGMMALTPTSLRVLGGAWMEEQPSHQQQQPPAEYATDDMDIDIAAIEAMERAALAQRQQMQQVKQEVKQEPPAPQTAPPVRKKSRKKFLDDDD